MNLILLLLFSWAIFFFLFHRYHSGQYYSPEGFQATEKTEEATELPNVTEETPQRTTQNIRSAFWSIFA